MGSVSNTATVNMHFINYQYDRFKLNRKSVMIFNNISFLKTDYKGLNPLVTILQSGTKLYYSFNMLIFYA